MPKLAAWIRAMDEVHFRRYFGLRPALRVLNARLESVDLDAIDGLLLTGGADIAGEFLKQEIADHSLIRGAKPDRDAWEFEAVRRVIEREKPILAVCKGLQLLNVALGGTLLLDIPGHNLPEGRTENIQPLRFAAKAGYRYELVNSSHHQAIDRLGEGLEVEAWCASDEIIEQVHIRDYPFGLGVQYHPERGSGYDRLFEDFFDSLDESPRRG